MTQGVYLPHLYDGTRTTSWWDDFGFRLGKQWVSVAWVHPRMVLQDSAQTYAFDKAGEAPKIDWGKQFVPAQTKQLGRSRKKLLTYEWKSGDESNSSYYARVRELEAAALAGDVLPPVKPSIKVEQLAWSRYVTLTYPVELLTAEDVIAFAHRVRAHLKGEEDLFAGLGDYEYTPAHYRQDVSPENTKLHSHALS